MNTDRQEEGYVVGMAFIIMQLGNPVLDTVCREAIIPALKACGLDPRRADKHNTGKLLPSEIADFIKTADIIVADLTNERPNCYLEVGYTMGLGKFENLVLTAREDHNQDSPNHRAGGPKIHFDLSAYDILFWGPEQADSFREELQKRVKRRLAILPAHKDLGQNERWFQDHTDHAEAGLTKTGKIRFMEIRMSLPGPVREVPQRQLLDAAARSEINASGWPIGIVFESPDDYRPRATADGIAAEVLTEEGRYDYWAIRKDLSYYLLESLLEDEVEQHAIFFDTRIVRITETLIHAARLYQQLGLREDSPILITIRHCGLTGCILAAGNRERRFFRVRQNAAENEVSTTVMTSILEIDSHLVEVVERFTKDLFIVFGFFVLKTEILTEIVSKFRDSVK